MLPQIFTYIQDDILFSELKGHGFRRKTKVPMTACVSFSQVESLLHEEVKKGILGVETRVASDLTAFPPGYIDKVSQGRQCHITSMW